MRRRLGWILFAACIAYPTVLTLLPGTRWAVTSRLRVLFSGQDSYSWSSYIAYRDPREIVDRDTALTSMAGLYRQPNMASRYEIARRHWADPLFIAAYVGQACRFAKIPSPIIPSYERKQPQAWLERCDRERSRYRPVWSRLIEACQQGMKLEPENAMYPAVAASAGYELGRKEDAIRYLRIAGRCSHLNSHSDELVAAYRKALIREIGYLGYMAIADIYCNPADWTADVRTLASRIALEEASPSNLRSKQDIVHVVTVAYDDAKSFQSANAAARIVGSLADPEPPIDRGRVKARERLLAKLDGLAAQLAPTDPGPLSTKFREMTAATDYLRRDSYRSDANGTAWERIMDVQSTQYVAPSCAAAGLVAVLSMLVLLGSLALISRLPEGFPNRASIPYVAAAALSFSSIFTFHFEPTYFGVSIAFGAFYLAAAALASVSRLEVPIPAATVLIPGAAAVPVLLLLPRTGGHDLQGYVVVPACAFPFLLGVLWWRRDRRSKLFVLPLLGVLAFGLGALWVGGYPAPPLLMASRYLLLLTISLSAVSLWQGAAYAEAAMQMLRQTYWLTAVAGLFCGLMLTWFVLLDPKGLAEIRSSESSAPLAREWAHANPEGLLPELRIEEASQKSPPPHFGS